MVCTLDLSFTTSSNMAATASDRHTMREIEGWAYMYRLSGLILIRLFRLLIKINVISFGKKHLTNKPAYKAEVTCGCITLTPCSLQIRIIALVTFMRFNAFTFYVKH